MRAAAACLDQEHQAQERLFQEQEQLIEEQQAQIHALQAQLEALRKPEALSSRPLPQLETEGRAASAPRG